MNSDLEEKLKELKRGYIIKLKDSLLVLKNILASEEIDIQDLYSKIHTTAGTSGMYGLADLSEISTEFEFYLKSIKENSELINEEELKNKFSNYLEAMAKILLAGE